MTPNTYNDIAMIATGLAILWCVVMWAVEKHKYKTRCKVCGGKLMFLDYKHPSGIRWFRCTDCGAEEYSN